MTHRHDDLDRNLIQNAYRHWAPIYDAVCGPVMLKGRRAAAEAARDVGGRVLEVGVGTGLSFSDYNENVELYGIDLCEPMLEKARAKMATGRFPHVKAVMCMDAHDLAFDDQSFDCVVAQFVITLVEHPEKVLSECFRVLKPGGRIILVNHLYSEKGMAAAFERWAAKHAGRLGLRPQFPFSRLADWAHEHGAVSLIERRTIATFYTLVCFERLGSQQSVAA